MKCSKKYVLWPEDIWLLVGILAAALMLCSCATPKRCARLYPPMLVQDSTVRIVHDTVRIAGRERVDTLINIRTLRDTTYLTTERVRVQWRVITDTLVQLRVDCPADTLRSTHVQELVKQRLVHRIPADSPALSIWVVLVIAAVGLLLLILVR